MPADCNYDDVCQLPSCHLPQDRSTWPVRHGLHLGPKQWAAWRGPSNYHVWPPAAQLSGGDDQRWLGTRFLTGPQDFQSLGASASFPMFLLCSNKYSKKPLFSNLSSETHFPRRAAADSCWITTVHVTNDLSAIDFVGVCCRGGRMLKKKIDWALVSTCELVTARYTFLKCCVFVCVLEI